MKHLGLLFGVFMMTAFGVFVIGIDVYLNKTLHTTNILIGGVSLLLAIALALPLQMKEAISTVTPFVDRLRSPIK